ncbi:MAG: beta-ketoacyl-ACP synthase II [Dehalococcoidia bacterium]
MTSSGRIFVTGVGAVTPVGNSAPDTWNALIEGRSGIGWLTQFDAHLFPQAIAGEVKDFQPDAVLPAKELRYMDRYVQLASVSALEALADAGIDASGGLGPRAGVVFSAGSGGYHVLEEQWGILETRGPRRVSPFFLTHILPDAASGQIAILTGAMGPNMAVVAACATGTSSVGEAWEIIRRGDADMMIAGGAEAPLIEVLYSSFNALRAIATVKDEDPAAASCPFDARRDGFVIAEGAGCLILESEEHARARGAEVYAELIGYGSSNDAFDMVASEESGRGPVLAVEMALRKAAVAPGFDPTQIGYVNAHGTSTPMNDRVETVALKRVFGDHARTFAVSSIKGATGHMMGAAGAVEAVVSTLALRHETLPPTLHYRVPDPECDLDYVPNTARQAPGLQAVLSTSVGLGGHNSALILRRA